MIVQHFEETAATSSEQILVQTDHGVSTSRTPDVMGVRLLRPGLFIAGIVLSAALSSGGQTGNSISLPPRRNDDVICESSTSAVEVGPVLLEEVRELFEQGGSEFFHDGMHSKFSQRLVRTLSQHGLNAFRAISQYLFSGNAKPDVVSEALRWLADFNDASSTALRWAILRRTLSDRSPRVRDGAILGFAALDDSRARSVLLEARNLEQISELRTLIDQVVAQLERVR